MKTVFPKEAKSLLLISGGDGGVCVCVCVCVYVSGDGGGSSVPPTVLK